MPNRLAHEKSPYLLQHADNPVDWYPWGEDALAKAKAEDKPIFLSIGYATCHWCHVMAHESFEDREVAAALKRDYVAVKVDREERPDLDGVYMTVCQALTGSGGWPLSVWLTPEGKPFFAGTYFPKTTRFGRPGFLEVLGELARRWKSPEKSRMIQAAEQVTGAIRTRSAAEGPELDEGTLSLAYEQLERTFDPAQGGFGHAPKFPTPHHLTFLLRWHLRQPDSGALAMAEKTLLAMRDGGMYDQVGLGFHRYSVDAQWLVPHFEKMLYDQAMLAMAYLEAYQLTGKERYATAAREVFEYVLRDMTSPQGGFYSAEDADSEGEEGLFYVWRPAEVVAVLGEKDGGLFCRRYGITSGGNFEHGASIPYLTQSLAEFARAEGLSEEEAAEALESARKRLFAAREGRVHPLKDDKVITSWNGLMIAALAKGAQALGEPAYLEAAQRAADFAASTLTDADGRLLRRWRDGHLSGPGFLDDYAFLAWGLIELYETGFDPDRLAEALRLTRLMEELFWDAEGGGYFYTPAGGENLIMRDKEIYDGATPSGNSVAALNLLRLARLTGDTGLEERAWALMAAFAAQVSQQPMAYTQLMNALDFALGPASEVVVVGEKDAADTEALVERLHRAFQPRRALLLRGSAEAARLDELAPFTADMATRDGKAAAYVCRDFACAAPVSDPDELEL